MRPGRRGIASRGRIIGALAVAVVLAACSAVRLGYDQAPHLAYLWLDRYADFNESQAPRAREALTNWFRWHRSTELPDYAALLARAGAEVQHAVTAEQVCRWVDVGRERALKAVDHALPDAAALVLTLSPAQLRHIERRFASNNDDFSDEYLQETPEARREASLERTVDRSEELYGPLDDSQRERVVRALASSPFDPDLWLAERRARQQDTMATLRRLVETRAGAAEAEQALRDLAKRYARSPREAWRRYETRLLAYNCAFGAELHNSTSTEQRQHAAKRLKGWEDDLRALASQRPL